MINIKDKNTWRFIVPILFFLLLSCSVQEKEMSNKEKAGQTAVRTDITGLQKNISLKYLPQSVQWVKKRIGQENNNNDLVIGPTDYVIMAVLVFNDPVFKELQVEMNEYPFDIVLDSNFIEEWFSASIKESFVMDGEYLSVNKKVFSANIFYASPFVNGYCFLTEDKQIFVCMWTT